MDSILPLLLLSVVSLFVLIPRVSANKYCGISPRHVMCLYQVNKLGSQCPKGAKIVSADANDKKIIVDMHNELRRKVAQGLEKQGRQGGQPPASNMIELKWDDELATLAQTWANQCIYNHPTYVEPKIENSVERFPGNDLGQNGGQISGNTAPTKIKNWPRQIKNWYDKEVKYMKNSFIQNFPLGNDAKGIGHYTQVIWGKTKYVGCGAVHFKTEKGKDMHQYFCNYGPTGNMPSEPIYEKGNGASKCPKGTRAYNGLCRF